MADKIHPAAPHVLPSFLPGPDGGDTLLVVIGCFLLFSVFFVGVLFLRLHTLPERMAHKSEKLQFEIVAVLGLIALFTHMHIFWIAGLLLAMIDLPDFASPLGRMARALEKLAGIKPSRREREQYDGNPTVEAEARIIPSHHHAHQAPHAAAPAPAAPGVEMGG
ncbi:MAG: hypothetical protein U1E62_10475 [Alsobacter sp.]